MRRIVFSDSPSRRAASGRVMRSGGNCWVVMVKPWRIVDSRQLPAVPMPFGVSSHWNPHNPRRGASHPSDCLFKRLSDILTS
jgi:hypothetical protein